MPSFWTTLACTVALAAFWTALGWPIARRSLPAGPLVLPCAPAIGWAVHTATALPIFLVCGFTGASVAAVAVLLLAAAGAAVWFEDRPRDDAEAGAGVPWIAYAAAMLLACIPMLAILPKITDGGVLLSPPIFDHAKIALVDEIARSGLPPVNPFFGGDGAPAHLAYYYGWHFSAAMVARVLALDGWTADAALTGFTAFSSLTLMMGLACWLGRRRAAAWLVLPLCLVGSLRPLLSQIFGPAAVDRVLSTYPGLAGWIVQASWVPQHLASGVCVVLVALLSSRLADRRLHLVSPVLALVASAGFAASTWVGGVLLALAAPTIGLVVVGTAPRDLRRLVIVRGLTAAGAALILALALLHDQLQATEARQTGVPLAFHAYEVLGPLFAEPLRRWLDLPAYWIVLLPLTFSAAIVVGPIFLLRAIKAERAADRRTMLGSLAAIAAASFVTAWLFISTIGNNDLGWRVVLPGILVVTGAAAAAFANLSRRHVALATALGIVLLATTNGWQTAYGNLTGRASADAGRFAAAPDLWAAVRRYASATDRIGNNPFMLRDMLPWPVDISWALLARRRSCFAGWELTRAYAALPQQRVTDIDAAFIRVFDGRGSDAEIRDLATTYGCTLLVITPQDPVWDRTIFETSGLFALVAAEAGWKIFRRTALDREP